MLASESHSHSMNPYLVLLAKTTNVRRRMTLAIVTLKKELVNTGLKTSSQKLLNSQNSQGEHYHDHQLLLQRHLQKIQLM